MAAAIEFRDVSVKTAEGRVLLDHVNLSLEEGTTTAVLGRSGSGKTTLLRLVNRMLDPTSGTVFIRGKECEQLNVIALRRGIGYVIQETGLFPHFTVTRNVGLVPELNGKRIDEEKMRELLEQVGLDAAKFAGRYPHQLSGGQRQRVGLARALAAGPAILLMDEPFGALDPLTRAEMQDMLRDLLKRLKKTVLIVTHDLDEALYLASRIVLLEDGRVVTDVAAEDFLRSEIPAVKAYAEAFHRGQKDTGQEQRQ
jgi:osmoprotectant transport system ATP-binding protein